MKQQEKIVVPFNKRRHLQASFHFLVSAANQQTFKNSDHFVSWKHVELVYFLSEKPRLCPICLEPPIAAQITECGHVFCWPCILHYLCVDSDREVQRCPLCLENIMRDSLRSSVAIMAPKVTVGMEVEMTLVQRPKDSLKLLVPAAVTDPTHQPEPAHAHIDSILFNRVTEVEDLDVILAKETCELNEALCEDELDPLDASFVQMALDALAARRAKWTQRQLQRKQRNDSSTKSPIVLKFLNSQPQFKRKNYQENKSEKEKEKEKEEEENADFPALPKAKPRPKPVISSVSADAPAPVPAPVVSGSVPAAEFTLPPPKDQVLAGEPAKEGKEKSPAELEPSSPSHLSASSPTDFSPEHMYRFFQCSDGQQIYLDSLNYRCLVAEFGVENLPLILSGKIVTLTEFSQVGPKNKSQPNYRFLSHLPTSSKFKIAYLNLDHLLSAKTLKQFNSEIKHVQKQLKQKESSRKRMEKLAAQRAQEIERQQQEEAAYAYAYSPNEFSSFFEIPDTDTQSFPEMSSGSHRNQQNGAQNQSPSMAGASSPHLSHGARGWSNVAETGANHLVDDHWEALPSRQQSVTTFLSTSASAPQQASSSSSASSSIPSDLNNHHENQTPASVARSVWGTAIPSSRDKKSNKKNNNQAQWPAPAPSPGGRKSKSKRGTVLFTFG